MNIQIKKKVGNHHTYFSDRIERDEHGIVTPNG